MTLHWLEYLVESGIVNTKSIAPVLEEADEQKAMMSSGRLTARASLKR